jgi:carbon monoxide dehydrogenase subunit G
VQRNEASVEIDAPPEAVYARILDPADRVRWVQGLVESEETAPGRFREVVSDHGMRTTVEVETVRDEPPLAADARMTNRQIRATVRNRLEPTESGTRLTVTIETEYRGLLARAASGLVSRHAQKNLEHSVENLKRLVEGVAEPSAASEPA